MQIFFFANFEIQRKLRFAGFSIFFGVRKWIRFWKVTKLRPNMGLIAGISLLTETSPQSGSTTDLVVRLGQVRSGSGQLVCFL
jgi:hypothetical protein